MKKFLYITFLCVSSSLWAANMNVFQNKTAYTYPNMKKLLNECILLLNEEEEFLASGMTQYLDSNNYFVQMRDVLDINLNTSAKNQKIVPLWVAGKNQEKLFEFQNLFLKTNEYMTILLQGVLRPESEIKKLYEGLAVLKSAVIKKLEGMKANYLSAMSITKPQSLKSKIYAYMYNKINTLPLVSDQEDMRKITVELRGALLYGSYNQRTIAVEEYCYACLYILIIRQLRYLSAKMESKKLLGHLKMGILGTGALTGLGLAARYFIGGKKPVVSEHFSNNDPKSELQDKTNGEL